MKPEMLHDFFQTPEGEKALSKWSFDLRQRIQAHREARFRSPPQEIRQNLRVWSTTRSNLQKQLSEILGSWVLNYLKGDS